MVLDPQTEGVSESWNAFVDKSPQGSIYATTTYLDALDVDYKLLALQVGDTIQAGMVLSKGMFKSHSNPLFVKYLGLMFEPMASPKQAVNTSREIKLSEPFINYLKTIPGVQYTFSPEYTYWAPFYWAGYKQQTAYTYVMPLSRKDSWFKEATNEVRICHRKALENGFKLVRLNPENEDEMAGQYALNMAAYLKRNQKPPISRERFDKFVRAMHKADAIRLYTVRNSEGMDLVSGVIVFDKRKSYFIINGTHDDAPHFANSFLFTELVKTIHDMGLDFDFEGSMIEPIAHFIRFFNGEITAYSRIWKPDLRLKLKTTVVKTARSILGYNR